MGNTILLADKSITIQKIVELTFADEDYVIRSVNDGHTALEMIPQIQPDIVLADIGLPGVSGYDLCTSLRTDPSFASFSKTPVILLAGIYETMDEDRAKQVEERVKSVGANDYLSKPFDSQLLTEKVKGLLAGAQARSVDDTSPGDFATNVGIFTESNSSSTEKTESFSKEELEPPPDDTEKTMMIERPSFSGSMFADKSPFEEERSGEDGLGANTVKLSVSDLDAARNAYSRIGRDEPAASLNPDDSHPFGVESTLSMQVSSVDLAAPTEIMPGNDEPFGVFEESTARWRLSPLAEEENPFGLPEQEVIPPAPPEAVQEEKIETPATPEPVMTFEVEKEEPEFETATFQQDTVIEGLSYDSEPLIPEETTVPKDSPVVETLIEESTDEGSMLEDTWPGTRKIPITEEVKLSADTLIEEAEEMASDTSQMSMPEAMEEFDNKPQEAIDVPVEFDAESSNQSEALEEAVRPVVSSAIPGEISDELIDRIVEKVMARLSEKVISEIAWQVVPDLAEKMIRRELEKIQAGEE
jgi:CheY-like chemotaxis protein